MSENMKDRLRRAVLAAPEDDSPVKWADAVIGLFVQELMEPSEEMVKAVPYDPWDKRSGVAQIEQGIECYRAMLRSILDTKEAGE